MNNKPALAYVSNANKVSVIDTATNTIVDNIAVGNFPQGISYQNYQTH